MSYRLTIIPNMTPSLRLLIVLLFPLVISNVMSVPVPDKADSNSNDGESTFFRPFRPLRPLQPITPAPAPACTNCANGGGTMITGDFNGGNQGGQGGTVNCIANSFHSSFNLSSISYSL